MRFPPLFSCLARTRLLPASLLALGVLLGASAVRAEDPPPRAPGAEPAPAPPRMTVGVIRGQRVNLRVGPRIDVRPVRTVDEGTVVLIVERVPGWFGIRLPIGFPASVSDRYLEPVGADAVRVVARNLNMRVTDPQPGKQMPGAFRDHPAFGALLPVIERNPGWVRVLAPEEIRVYVSERFVRELGSPEEHAALVEAARAERRAYVARMAAERKEQAAQRSGLRLREALGDAQQALYRLRIEGGFDRTPVVKAINTLEAALEKGRMAPADARRLAQAIRADLEAELEIRMARKDAEVARLRGLDPEPESPATPRQAAVRVEGKIRWEAAPTWRNGGAYVLWQGETPTHVLRLTTGLPRPLPDLKGHAGGGVCVIEGSQPGELVFGLPVVEVRTLRAARAEGR